MRTFLFYFFFLQVVSLSFAQEKQPNIVWISFEDTGIYLPSYGDSTAQLPIINQLAKESAIYRNAFSTAGVCAPSRSAIITGMYPSTIGTSHMRTGRDITGIGSRKYRKNKNVVDRENNNVREYSAVVPWMVKCFPEYLRANGYYTTNNAKTDYQFAAPFTAWDENDGKAHWRNRADGQPFFAVFNFNETHESKIWKNKHLPLTVAKEDVPVPPYYIDNDTTRTDLARMYSNLELLDKRVGQIIHQLKEDGLYDNTIIFFFSDHGGPLPRQKREVIASGLHVPFFIKYPKGANSGKTDQLINFIDLAPTVLEMTGIEVPKHIQGQSILSTTRKYSFAARDRMDEFTSARRSVTDGKYLYVKYLFPIPSNYQDIQYRMQVPIMENLKNAYLNGELNQIQAAWFSPLQEEEQLFDLENDPYETHNLIHHPKAKAEVKRFRKQLAKWQKQTPDICIQPEAEMISAMWPNNQQPTTAKVEASIKANLLTLNCATQGASIGYQIDGGKWKLYTTSIAINKASKIEVKAIRIGFKEAIVSTVNLVN
ncbi:DUF229 domain-containing protein [Flammeovirga pectinis]|uniref:DUF229 domain-containing protein n=1 Tax=Flammeovirga pectinis TaxID=2494373 RepID=A0A3Q9FRQ8_9BACT|nr:sulfatase-like hydrolase/transferase [Flammeovirga pectinis]AZQ64859.1 DUF229 domain-containing protein [Flammeovirga pectinis]